jgi:chromosome segregation ATPase
VWYFWTKADYNALMLMLTRILSGQQELQSTINKLLKQEKNVMSALDDLKAQVQENTNLEQSAVTAIQGIAAQLRDALANDDSAALQALSQQLDASAAGLASAIAANTPAAGGGGEPTPEPMARRR